MSASEKDREAALALLDVLRRCGTGVNSKRVDRIAEAIATARAEGETAGYAKGRREAFSEAAAVADNVAGQYGSGSGQWAACRGISGRMRAKAGEEAPHE